MKTFRHSIIIIVFALFAGSLITACETFNALSTVEKPRTYKETVFVLEEDIKAARDMTVLLARNGTITRAQAQVVNKQTKGMLESIDTIWVSLALVGGDLSMCRITYGGVELPCNTASDKMLFLLLKIQGELEKENMQ